MKLSKKAAVAAVMVMCGVMFTACGNNEADMQNSETSMSDRAGTSPINGDGSMIGGSTTGDIDGDGFIEDAVTEAGDMVSDIVTGARDIADDIIPDENDNSTVTTTAE